MPARPRHGKAPRALEAYGKGPRRMGTGYQVQGGIIPSDWPWNFWQQGRDVIPAGPNSTVHACVDAYAQSLASLKARHVRQAEGKGTEILTTSALHRFFRRPNSYQTRSDYMLNMVKGLLLTGNSYAICYRNDRREIDSMHLVDPRSTQVLVEPETREIFYGLGTNPMIQESPVDVLVPARDVMHVRLYTPRHPLVGVTPIQHLAMSIASTNAIHSHQAGFFSQMARPSGVLSTKEKLNRDQMVQLREMWNAQSAGLNSGGIPILAYGVEWHSMALDSQDAQTVEAFRMGVEDIARAFRVPLPLIGDTRNSNYNSVEQLIQVWLAMGLGFFIEHLERAFDAFFELPLDTYTQIDVDSLMRTDFAGRIEALAKGIQGGLYSPNEARRKEGLSDVNFGKEPRVQAQVVPLSQAGKLPPAAPSAPAPAAPVEEQPKEDPERARLMQGMIKGYLMAVA